MYMFVYLDGGLVIHGLVGNITKGRPGSDKN